MLMQLFLYCMKVTPQLTTAWLTGIRILLEESRSEFRSWISVISMSAVQWAVVFYGEFYTMIISLPNWMHITSTSNILYLCYFWWLMSCFMYISDCFKGWCMVELPIQNHIYGSIFRTEGFGGVTYRIIYRRMFREVGFCGVFYRILYGRMFIEVGCGGVS